MRLTLHWRGRPLLALDVTAQSPEAPDRSLDPPMGMSAAPGGQHELAEPMEGPDTTVRGFGFRR